MPFKWTTDLATGDPAVDAQHRGIFRRVNRLLGAMMDGTGLTEVHRFAAFLDAYAVTHFQDEERAMLEAGYPDLDAHAASHAAFRRDLADLIGGIDDGQGLAYPVLQVQRRVCDWLTNHIGESDRAFADFVRRGR